MSRELSLRVIFAGVDKLTSPLRRIGGVTKETQKSISATRKEIVQLEKSAGRIGGYKDQQQAIAKTHAEMDAARRRMRQLEEQIGQTDGRTKRMTNSLESQKRTYATLETKLQDQTAKLRTMGTELSDAGIDVRNLAREQADLARKTDIANRELAEQIEKKKGLDRVRRRADKLSATGDKLQSVGARSMAAGTALALPLGLAARAAMEFEDAMADVRKVVNVSDAEFAQLGKGIRDLSHSRPMEPAQIATIAAAGARAGVASKDLLAFADDAVKMGIAFDMTADQAGETMAIWRNAFKMSQPEVRALGDRINALTNAYGGNVVAVTEMVNRIGPLGDVAGVSASSLAALSQLMNSVGIQSEIGATGIKNMMLALSKGDSAAKSQKKAFAGLGLNAADVARRMQVDSEGTILDVLTRISKLSSDKQAGVLNQLFGSESIAAIAPLLTNLDALKRNFAMVGDEAQWAGSMTAEYESRAATSSMKIQVAQNSIRDMGISIGILLLPVLVKLAQWLATLADKVTAFAAAHPELASAITTIIAGIAGLLLVFGGLSIAIGVVLKPIALLVRLLPILGIGAKAGERISLLTRAMRLLGKAGKFLARGLLAILGRMGPLLLRALTGLGPLLLRGLTAALALFTNPVGWTILAVAAVAMIWYFWDEIKAALSSD